MLGRLTRWQGGPRQLRWVPRYAGRVDGLWLGLATLAIITAIFTTTQSAFNMYVFDTVLLACMGAIALNVLMGTTGQVSLGNAAFLLVGALSTVFLTRAGLQFPFDVVGAVLVTGVIGVFIGLPALRLAGLFLSLATLAAHFIVIYFGNLYQSRVPGAEVAGFSLRPLFPDADFAPRLRYWGLLLFGVVAVLIVLARLITRERAGRALRMIRDHEFVAPMFGIPVARYKLMIFALTSMVVGLEGALGAHFASSVSTDNYTLLLAIQYLAMILIGGLDSIVGSMIGATIVVALPALVPNVVSLILEQSSAARQGPPIAQILYGVLIIIFITSSPDGIMGWLRHAFPALPPARDASRSESIGAIDH